jgi:hypothetical protein
MFVNHLYYSSEDANIRDSQQFAANHGESVTERNYVSDIVKETKNLTGLLAYRDAVEGLEDNNSFSMTSTVDQRAFEASKIMKKEREDNAMKQQRRKD